jgi:hypothetical protein
MIATKLEALAKRLRIFGGEILAIAGRLRVMAAKAAKAAEDAAKANAVDNT